MTMNLNHYFENSNAKYIYYKSSNCQEEGRRRWVFEKMGMAVGEKKMGV
jgi:hypothetical protein